MTNATTTNAQIRIEFSTPIDDEQDFEQVEATLRYWGKNRAITNGQDPVQLEWSPNLDSIMVSGDFETGNCWRKHHTLSDDWLKPLDMQKRRGYDLTSLLNRGKVNVSKDGDHQSFNPIYKADVINVQLITSVCYRCEELTADMETLPDGYSFCSDCFNELLHDAKYN